MMGNESAESASTKARQEGKRLSEIEKSRNEAASTASGVGRQLAFAGIAVVWLLRSEAERPFTPWLFTALILLCVALLVDFSQYVWCTNRWRKLYKELYAKHKNDEALVDIPDVLSDSMWKFFWWKIGILFSGYFLLIIGASLRLRLFA
ncbi:hypothetical protein H4F99_13360 [Lysobacter sp. SG-8]|uniref:Transmembrane protein n=1 Tax=Marilutibacter penaei TaxID=2759900 RepID=A0A7W3U5U4_9GAMM|nr:hypothetical protein [Lysobacter penaei]MBB1089466.1 hypothetical protein [Lysobacter penaei]